LIAPIQNSPPTSSGRSPRDWPLLNPPEHAVVLCVDEKPQIQALERAQGWLRRPTPGVHRHGYKRGGTKTLFAALEVPTGLVTTGRY
jgi:hypothetical protein